MRVHAVEPSFGGQQLAAQSGGAGHVGKRGGHWREMGCRIMEQETGGCRNGAACTAGAGGAGIVQRVQG